MILVFNSETKISAISSYFFAFLILSFSDHLRFLVRWTGDKIEGDRRQMGEMLERKVRTWTLVMTNLIKAINTVGSGMCPPSPASPVKSPKILQLNWEYASLHLISTKSIEQQKLGNFPYMLLDQRGQQCKWRLMGIYSNI